MSSVKVMGQVLGGRVIRDIEATTVRDVFNAMQLQGNYTALVSGYPANMETAVKQDDFVVFAAAVKGGC